MSTPVPPAMPDAAALLQQADVAIRALPAAMHVLMGSVFTSGLVLLFFGAKVVKPIFVLVMGLGAGMIGAFLPPLLGYEQVGELPAVYLGLGFGVVVGTLLGITLYRFAIAAAGGMAFLGAAVVGTLVYLSGVPGALPPIPASASTGPRESNGSVRLDTSALQDPAGALEDASARVREFAHGVGAEVLALWEATPTQTRLMLVGGALGGWLFGFALGVIMPKRTAALMTALGGAALVVACGAWNLHALDTPLAQKVAGASIKTWAGAWGGLAVVGFMVQLMLLRPKKQST